MAPRDNIDQPDLFSFEEGDDTRDVGLAFVLTHLHGGLDAVDA